MVNIQIFGIKNSAATRAAERFFKERRVPIHFVDLKQKPMSTAEIQRFLQRFGLAALLDTASPAYTDAGLQYLKMSETEWRARIDREPRLLRLPLVRAANRLSVGQDQAAWETMLTPPERRPL